MIQPLLIGLVALSVTVPSANAACDISQTKCALNGGKCNIHFKNKTGDTHGSDRSSSLKQLPFAQTVIVKARTEAEKKIGNKLTITAGASKTMNVDKKSKKDFQDIRIYSKDFAKKPVRSIILRCEDIKAILNGNGTCKVFYGSRTQDLLIFKYGLGYQCNGGKIGGPKKCNQSLIATANGSSAYPDQVFAQHSLRASLCSSPSQPPARPAISRRPNAL